MLDKMSFLTLRLNDDFQLEIGSRERERISNWKSVEVSIRTDTTASRWVPISVLAIGSVE